MKNKKFIIAISVCLGLTVVILAIFIFIPKPERESNEDTEPTNSIFEEALFNPDTCYIVDPDIISRMKEETYGYDIDVGSLQFQTDDGVNLYCILQYDEYTIIGLYYNAETDDVKCEVQVTEYSMMPEPIEEQ